MQYKRILNNLVMRLFFILETYNQPLFCLTTLKFIHCPCNRSPQTTSTTYY